MSGGTPNFLYVGADGRSAAPKVPTFLDEGGRRPLSRSRGLTEWMVAEMDRVRGVAGRMRPGQEWTRLLRPLLAIALLLAGLGAVSSAPASADSAPQNPADPATPTTVSADALPTVQINGVVWSQAMVGDIVYAGGSFTTARPAGSGGTAVTRNNMLAYNIRTGALVTSFAPSFNAQIKAVAVSPDKSRIYVGGDFTTVNGLSHRRIAAFNATTGALLETFNPPVNYSVNALAATNTTVYAGGEFQGVGSQDRQGLAAFNASNGALLNWAPAATGGGVWAVALNPAGTKLAVGGSFTALNGSSNPGYGLGMVDALDRREPAVPGQQHRPQRHRGRCDHHADRRRRLRLRRRLHLRSCRRHLGGRVRCVVERRGRALGRRLPRRHLLAARAGRRHLRRQPHPLLREHRRHPAGRRRCRRLPVLPGHRLRSGRDRHRDVGARPGPLLQLRGPAAVVDAHLVPEPEHRARTPASSRGRGA